MLCILLLKNDLIRAKHWQFLLKQASLTGHPTTLEQKRSFQPRFNRVRP